eukprot:GHVU01011140.1.p1 GENE.GHVU01011140.1~~GHVU01011140.1.p1  ORF type:complete len:229 (+),score=55.24 GHVU01011140.1:300-986(+)
MERSGKYFTRWRGGRRRVRATERLPFFYLLFLISLLLCAILITTISVTIIIIAVATITPVVRLCRHDDDVMMRVLFLAQVTLMGDDIERKLALAWLRGNVKGLRFNLAKRIRHRKRIPELYFYEIDVDSKVNLVTHIERMSELFTPEELLPASLRGRNLTTLDVAELSEYERLHLEQYVQRRRIDDMFDRFLLRLGNATDSFGPRDEDDDRIDSGEEEQEEEEEDGAT